MKNLLFISIAILGMMACKTKKEVITVAPIVEEEKVNKEDEGNMEFGIKRGGCFGKCPIYELEVYEGGYAVLKGKRFIEQIGKHVRQLDPNVYEHLKTSFSNADFYNYQNEYESNIADLPSIKLFFYTADGGQKEVRYKHGEPAGLKELQLELESIVKSDGWHKSQELIENEKIISMKEDSTEVKMDKNIIQTEIIMEPRPGLPIVPWFKRHKEKYGVTIKNKIAPNLNLWVITFDTDRISPKDMLAYLKAHKDIISAEFNKSTSPR